MSDSEKPLSLAESVRRKIAESSQANQPGNDRFAGDTKLSSAPAKPGDSLTDRYELLNKLEADEKTETYTARHVPLDREVVIEILKPEYVNDAEAQTAMLKKAMSLRATETTYGAVCDFGMNNGRYYLVFVKSSSAQFDVREYGETLAAAIRKKIDDSTDHSQSPSSGESKTRWAGPEADINMSKTSGKSANFLSGHYELLNKLEEDGKTQTYAARRMLFNRECVIQILKPEYADDVDAQTAMFNRASELSLRSTETKHGTICDFRTNDGRCFLVFAKSAH